MRVFLVAILVLAAAMSATGQVYDRIGVQDIRHGGSWTRTTAGGTATMYGVTPVDVRSYPFSAVGDGSTDDSGAIQAAIDSVEAWGGGTVYLGGGDFYLESGLTIDRDYVAIASSGDARLVSGHDGVCLTIGDTGRITRNIKVDGLYVYQAALDTTETGNVGIKLINVYNSYLEDISVENFKYGMYLTSAGASQGTSVNTIIPRQFRWCQYPVYLEPGDADSWVTSNIFIGGWYAAAQYGRNITVEWDGTGNEPNHNIFYSPVCEGNTVTYTALIDGDDNTILDMRNETNGGKIILPATSTRIGILRGYGVWKSRLVDSGAGNRIDWLPTNGGYYYYPDATAPDTTGMRGLVWYDAVNDVLKVYNGYGWQDLH